MNGVTVANFPILFMTEFRAMFNEPVLPEYA